MPVGEDTVYMKDRKEWRAWLRANARRSKGVWLVYYKKNSGGQSVAYQDAVEEAICFGWIDGRVKGIDDERFMQRYTPRSPRSSWSPTNVARAERMIERGLMTKGGLEAFEDAMRDGRVLPSSDDFTLPEDLEDAIRKDRGAWANYNNLAPSTQLIFVYWVESARREETRRKRVRKSVELLAAGKRPGE